MFSKTFHNALALLGLTDEPEPPSAETLCVDIGCLDLNDPCQAFDALRRAVSIARAQHHHDGAASGFDLAA